MCSHRVLSRSISFSSKRKCPLTNIVCIIGTIFDKVDNEIFEIYEDPSRKKAKRRKFPSQGLFEFEVVRKKILLTSKCFTRQRVTILFFESIVNEFTLMTFDYS